MANTSIDGRADYETIRRDIAALKGQLAELVGHVRQAAGDQARRGYEDLSARGDRAMHAATDHVRERPLTSVLMALALGYIVSSLLRR
jgi:ElaB/YqjD/DUF883 family membrane-anchored ribosome-binding protein